MNHISDFLINFLCAAAFCLAVAQGCLLLLSKRLHAPADKLQKFFGVAMLMIAVHLLLLYCESYFGTVAHSVFNIAVLILDLAVLISCIIFIINAIVASVPRNLVAEESSEEDVKDDNEEDVGDNLDMHNEDDLIFFQRVECLMVNERLFCEQEISREAVAAAIGTNRTYLARSIKSATGMTFSEYITTLRTSYAAKLLTTSDEPLDLIGTLVGFRSKSSYYRAFASAYGCSPSEYRKNSVCLHTLENASIQTSA